MVALCKTATMHIRLAQPGRSNRDCDDPDLDWWEQQQQQQVPSMRDAQAAHANWRCCKPAKLPLCLLTVWQLRPLPLHQVILCPTGSILGQPGGPDVADIQGDPAQLGPHWVPDYSGAGGPHPGAAPPTAAG